MGSGRSADLDDATDRARLLRRVGWERAGFRLFRAVIAGVLIAGGVASLAGVDDAGSSGLIQVALGLVILWEVARRGRSAEETARPLTEAQRAVLETTMQHEGRLAAVRQLREWTGATYGEAARDVNAAFPEPAQPPT